MNSKVVILDCLILQNEYNSLTTWASSYRDLGEDRQQQWQGRQVHSDSLSSKAPPKVFGHGHYL